MNTYNTISTGHRLPAKVECELSHSECGKRRTAFGTYPSPGSHPRTPGTEPSHYRIPPNVSFGVSLSVLHPLPGPSYHRTVSDTTSKVFSSLVILVYGVPSLPVPETGTVEILSVYCPVV